MDPYYLLPYESIAFPETHPRSLAVLGLLFGLETADPEICRVLEIGCASGGSLIPMAWHFPEARFLGIDLSARHIADGQAVITRLGLPNIELRQADILDLDAALGEFDLLIAHGVYSWVPTAVREHVLKIASALLAPNGLCYVRYNCLPGWRMRDILLHGCCPDEPPQQQIADA